MNVPHRLYTQINLRFKGFIYARIRHLEGRNSSVGVATRYGLDGPGIESRWGRVFQHPSRPALGSTQPPVLQGGPGHSRGESGRGVALTTRPI